MMRMTLQTSRLNSLISAALMTAFLFAGSVKGSLHLESVGVDLTLATAVAVASWVAVQALITRLALPRALIPVFMLYGTAVPALLWTDWGGYGTSKAGRFFSLTLLCCIAPILLFRNKAAVRWFLTTVGVLGLGVCAGGLLARLWLDPSLGRLDILSDTVTAGELAGLTVLWLFVLSMRARRWRHAAFAGLMVPAVVVLVFVGSRGPALAVFVALLVVVLIKHMRRFRVLSRWMTLASLFAVAFLLSLQVAPERSKVRLVQFASGEADLEATVRPMLFKAALKVLPDNPAGLGWGGFEKVIYGAVDSGQIRRAFPHNIVLEAFVEGGWIFGAGLVVFLGIAIFQSLSACMAGEAVESEVLFLWILLSVQLAMISGELTEVRVMFAFCALALSGASGRA